MSKFLSSLCFRRGDGFWMYVWKILVLIVAATVAFAGVLVFWQFCRYKVYYGWLRPALSNKVAGSVYLSDRMRMDYMLYGKGVRLYDKEQDKVVMKGLASVFIPENMSDSLTVFRKDGKRGYLNRFTGEVVIPARYRRAWVFSEGLAGVQLEDERIVFIDSTGNVVIDKMLRYGGESAYVFHDGLCRVTDYYSCKAGLIDTAGRWALEPEYDNVSRYRDFWLVKKDGLYGLLTIDLDTVLSVSYPRIEVRDDCIEVGLHDHTAKLLDYEGNVLEEFLIDEVYDLLYPAGTPVADEYGEPVDTVYARASCKAYMVYGVGRHYGLMSGDGRILTPPLYTEIVALGRDLYFCRPNGIVLNEKGQRVN